MVNTCSYFTSAVAAVWLAQSLLLLGGVRSAAVASREEPAEPLLLLRRHTAGKRELADGYQQYRHQRCSAAHEVHFSTHATRPRIIRATDARNHR